VFSKNISHAFQQTVALRLRCNPKIGSQLQQSDEIQVPVMLYTNVYKQQSTVKSVDKLFWLNLSLSNCFPQLLWKFNKCRFCKKNQNLCHNGCCSIYCQCEHHCI